MKKIFTLLLALSMVLSMTGCGGSAAETTAESTIEAGIYTPGNYTGQGQGHQSIITVSLTVDANSIVDVLVDVSGETPAIGAAAEDKLVQRILAAQGPDFDVVSGATATSKGAQRAVEQCLDLAMSVADMPAAG